MNKTQTFIDLVKSAVAVSTAKAQETLGDVKEALKLDMGNVLLATYQRYRQDGWPKDKALKMNLDLAKKQLTAKIEEYESAEGEF